MCRSIKVLRTLQPAPTSDDTRAAALQYVRKISGYRKPSRTNEAAFDRAVKQIARESDTLLESLNAATG